MHNVLDSPVNLSSQPVSAGANESCQTVRVDLAERLERARTELGWTQRQLGRIAGLRNDSHYNIILTNLRRGRTSQARTLDLIIGALVGEGWAEDWLRHGTGPERLDMTPIVPEVALHRSRSSSAPPPAPSSHITSYPNKLPLVIPTLPNREKARQLLVQHGCDPKSLDEELALIAFDAQLNPYEDRPVSWWIDAIRVRRAPPRARPSPGR